MKIYDMNPNITRVKNSKLKQIIKDVIEVPLIPFEGAKERACCKNVEDYINKFGGEPVTGYLVFSLGYILIKLIGHVIVNQNGKLFCVTPPEVDHITKRGVILFKPESFDYNDRLPGHAEALVRDPIVELYASYENQFESIRRKIPTDSTRAINGRIPVPAEYEDELRSIINGKAKITNQVRKKAFQSIDRNSPCICVSGKKFKHCCERQS
ncbi:TPA: SEC-C metal-binding domain-containing protein [Vibrio parahaemolyticus]